jgi:signal transduction histidine kinase
MLIFDPSINRYIDGNNAAVNYLGLESKEQLINMKPLDYIPEFQDNGERSDLAFSRFAKEVGVEKSLYFEWRILNAKQKTLYADVDLIRFIFDDKEYLRLSLIDITEIKLSHEKLKELNETLEKRVFDRTLELNQAFQQIENANFELKELNEDMAEESIKLVELNDKLVKSELELKQNNKIREKMFDAITHGIRNPLQAISLNIDIIKHHSDKLDKTELLNIFDNITVSFSNLNYQFEDILNFSRIKTGQHPVHSTEIKLKDFINVEIETYRPSISAKKMEVNNSIGEGFLIFTNHNVLNIVFIDLISSMLKSIQYNKKINIFDSSTFQNKCLSIQSTDTFFSDETIMECNNYLLNLDINVFRNINAFNFPKIIEYLDSINSRIEIENNQIGSLIKLFFPEKIEK